MSQIALPYDAASKVNHGPSMAAGDAIRPAAGTLRDKVMVVLARNPAGLTADEIAMRVGATILAIRPRVTELNKARAIEDTGLRRKNASGTRATVWRMT